MITMIPINVIDGGPVAFNALLYPEDNYNTIQYFQDNLNRLHEYANDTNQYFINKTKELYDSYRDNTLVNIAKSAINAAKGIFRPDIIMELTTTTIREPNVVMKRWLMAEPTFRKEYQLHRVCGYDDYYDAEPNNIGSTHSDYQLVMDGILHEVSNEDRMTISYYNNANLDGSNALSFENKVNILYTWDVLKNMLANDIDPSETVEDD